MADTPLPKLGLKSALVELVAARVTLAVRLTDPLVAEIFGKVAPARIVVLSLRGPWEAVPSKRLVVEAAWLTARVVLAVRVGSEAAS